MNKWLNYHAPNNEVFSEVYSIWQIDFRVTFLSKDSSIKQWCTVSFKLVPPYRKWYLWRTLDKQTRLPRSCRAPTSSQTLYMLKELVSQFTCNPLTTPKLPWMVSKNYVVLICLSISPVCIHRHSICSIPVPIHPSSLLSWTQVCWKAWEFGPSGGFPKSLWLIDLYLISVDSKCSAPV